MALLQPGQELGIVQIGHDCVIFEFLPPGLPGVYYEPASTVKDGDHLFDRDTGIWYDALDDEWVIAHVRGCSSCDYGLELRQQALRPRETHHYRWGISDGDVFWTGAEHLISQDRKWRKLDYGVVEELNRILEETNRMSEKIKALEETRIDEVVIGDTRVVLMADGRLVHESA